MCQNSLSDCALCGFKCAPEIVGILCSKILELQPQSFGISLSLFEALLSSCRTRSREKGYPCNLRNHLHQKFEPFRVQLWGEERKPSEISTGSRQACHLTVPKWIIGRGEDDGDGFGRVLRLLGGHGSIGNDDIEFETDQLIGEIRQRLELSFRISVLDNNVFSFHVAKLMQALLQCLNAPCRVGSRSTYENPYARDLARLLRLNWAAKRKEHSAQ